MQSSNTLLPMRSGHENVDPSRNDVDVDDSGGNQMRTDEVKRCGESFCTAMNVRSAM